LQFIEIKEIIRRYKFCIKDCKNNNLSYRVLNIKNDFEKKKNLIFKYFNLGLSRTNLVKITYRLLSLKEKEFIVYSDGSITDIEKPFVESTFAFIILDRNYNEIDSFSSSNEYWISSYQAEIFRLLLSLIILPEWSDVKVFTDLQSMIETFNKLITSRNTLATRKKFKIMSNNFLWVLLLEIIEILNISVELFKVKAHNQDIYNNRVDSLASLAHQHIDDMLWI
jgi:ribonuclease HI